MAPKNSGDLVYVNLWGLTGNGKSALFKALMEAFGEDARPLKKDTTRSVNVRPGERGNPEYRYIPLRQFERRRKLGQYRYIPEAIFDGGKANFTGIPKWEYLPRVSSSKLVVGSVFPVDKGAALKFPDRKILNVFVKVKDMEIIEARLRARCGDDLGTLEHKLGLNRAFREGARLVAPPHFYYPSVCHVVYNDLEIEDTLWQLVEVIPGLKERLR